MNDDADFFDTSPAGLLADLEQFFSALGKGHISLDEVLCRDLAQDCAAAFEKVAAMEALTRSYLAATDNLPPVTPLPNTAARRALVRSTVALDPERKVLAFPRSVRIAIAVSTGGDAA